MNTKESYLTQIITHKQSEIEKLKESQASIIEKASALPKTRHTFTNSIRTPEKLHLIAEVKKASPSKGIIRPQFNPIEIALEFQNNQASALSVLTETQFFLGDPDYIAQIKEQVSLPILRKDFIFDPIQVYRSKSFGADAILLIKAILSVSTCKLLIDIAHSLGLDVILEVHNLEEVEAIKTLTPDIIGINNRNLSTFEVDITQAEKLLPKIASFHTGPIIAESGYDSLKQLQHLHSLGFNAVLIGEGLAKQPDLLHYFAS
jgi:indole-3-glycerol phosphate synthase